MRKLIFIVWGMSLLLMNYSCGENLTREVTIRNGLDTTLVFMSKYDISKIDCSCEYYPMYRIEPGEAIVNTVELNIDKIVIFFICRDLTGDKRDLNTMTDCVLKQGILNEGMIEEKLYKLCESVVKITS